MVATEKTQVHAKEQLPNARKLTNTYTSSTMKKFFYYTRKNSEAWKKGKYALYGLETVWKARVINSNGGSARGSARKNIRIIAKRNNTQLSL